MGKKNIDDLIKHSLNGTVPPVEIDVKRGAMARIESYEKKREKIRMVLQVILSVFTACASAASVYIMEILIEGFSLYFQKLELDLFVIRMVFQGLFILIFLAALAIMISSLRFKKRFSNLLLII